MIFDAQSFVDSHIVFVFLFAVTIAIAPAIVAAQNFHLAPSRTFKCAPWFMRWLKPPIRAGPNNKVHD